MKLKFISINATGQLNPMTALARRLQAREAYYDLSGELEVIVR
jgi:hypothetical protein